MMKNNLKTFPRLIDNCIQGDRFECVYTEKFKKWLEDFEEELKENIQELYQANNRGIYCALKKANLIKEILGES